MLTTLSPVVLAVVIAVYFLLLIAISYFTGRDASNSRFFLAGRQSPWLLVAIGMVGASLSGVSFISIPGLVGAGKANTAFAYLQMVFGYLLGYVFIAQVLLPLYYKLQLTSIYTYLEKRFGPVAYKTGASFFLLSRSVGAAFRLFLVALVLDGFVLGPLGIPFMATVAVTIVLIWVYTFRGGINTIVWTDTIQTVAMLSAMLLTVGAILSTLDMGLSDMWAKVQSMGYGQVFFFEEGWKDPNNFFKQFISGALITIVMTGLDQDMMQKNLSCKTLEESRRNMYTFSGLLLLSNVLILFLGAVLWIFALEVGISIPEQTDNLYPTIALQNLPSYIGVVFLIGLIAAAYSSADSALTALTTSFCVDFLGFETKEQTEEQEKRLRFQVHVGFSILLFLIVVVFQLINDRAVINALFIAAGYTYGPLLGLFAFGLFTPLQVRDRWVWLIGLLAPVLSFVIDYYAPRILGGFEFGFLILALNGLLTFLGLLAISYREYEAVVEPLDALPEEEFH